MQFQRAFEPRHLLLPAGQYRFGSDTWVINVDILLAGIEQGDVLAMNSTKIFETAWNYTQGESFTVEAVGGSTITLSHPLLFAYDSATDGVNSDCQAPCKC